MDEGYVRRAELRDAAFLDRLRRGRFPLGFDLEVTARCNNDCRHCFINLPPDDDAAARELTLEEIERVGREAADLGAVWCLVTGGEPLLRPDFPDLYAALRRAGLLVSVYTNACLVTDEHVRLFRRMPPRDIEVTVYGATEQTYERVTQRRGSWRAFRRGVGRLLDGGVRVRFKAMALRSNVHELDQIAAFCRARTADYFRFDAMLHLRYDGDARRNELIRGERLSPSEVAALDRGDGERWAALTRARDRLVTPASPGDDAPLFRCNVGRTSFAVGYDGVVRPCASLWHPDFVVDLRQTSLDEAWRRVEARIAAARSSDARYLAACAACAIGNLCLACPAHTYLETGRLDDVVGYFCEVAKARAALLDLGVTAPEGRVP